MNKVLLDFSYRELLPYQIILLTHSNWFEYQLTMISDACSSNVNYGLSAYQFTAIIILLQ